MNVFAHKITVTEILLKIAGLSVLVSDAGFSAALNSLFGHYSTQIIAVIGLASMLAGQIVHGVNNVPVQEVAPTVTAPQAVVVQEAVAAPAPIVIPPPEI